jgi:hypothetical protein
VGDTASHSASKNSRAATGAFWWVAQGRVAFFTLENFLPPPPPPPTQDIKWSTPTLAGILYKCYVKTHRKKGSVFCREFISHSSNQHISPCSILFRLYQSRKEIFNEINKCAIIVSRVRSFKISSRT